MRAKFNEAVVVLGSATPSLESWSNSVRGRYARVEMLTRVMSRPLPTVELVDMRTVIKVTGKEDMFSRQFLGGRDGTGDDGPRGAGDHSAEPAGLLVYGAVPELR